MAIIWSSFSQSRDNLQYLRSLCHDAETLRAGGYVTSPLTYEQILAKLSCRYCGKIVPRRPVRPVLISQATRSGQLGASKDDQRCQSGEAQPMSRAEKKAQCTYHPGRVVNRQFECCHTRPHIYNHGCTTRPSHEAEPDAIEFLRQHWRFEHTSSVLLPSTHRLRGVRNAIALDCEMGINKYNDAELIRISAVDFFNKDILIDSLVNPAIEMKHYNTRYSGVTAADMRRAIQQGNCFNGVAATQLALARFLGPNTVLVMHGGSSDLRALRLIHPLVLDTCIFDKNLEEVEGGRSLKNLCAKRLGIAVQQGRRGHDSVEDAFACRELALLLISALRDREVCEEPDKSSNDTEIPFIGFAELLI